MHRTQLMLEEWQYDRLKALAESRGASISAILREILTGHLSDQSAVARKKLAEITGIGEGPADLAENHDRYLYGSQGDT